MKLWIVLIVLFVAVSASVQAQQSSQDSADTSGAAAAIQRLQPQTGKASTSGSQSQNLASQDPGDTTAASAVIDAANTQMCTIDEAAPLQAELRAAPAGAINLKTSVPQIQTSDASRKTPGDIAYDWMLEYLLEKGTGLPQSWEGAYQAVCLKMGSVAANFAAKKLGSELLSKAASVVASEAFSAGVGVFLGDGGLGVDDVDQDQENANQSFFGDPAFFCGISPNDARCSTKSFYEQLQDMSNTMQQSILANRPAPAQLQQPKSPQINKGSYCPPPSPGEFGRCQ
jgi:hypothetical protein